MEKYKIISENIWGDSETNTITLFRTYAVPFRRSSREAMLDFEKFCNRDPINAHGVLIDYELIGWGDEDYRTIEVLVYVTLSDEIE